jgi:hypothetical protein
MGLGKTLQTLSLLAYLHETHGVKGPHLLICPLSVLGSWITVGSPFHSCRSVPHTNLLRSSRKSLAGSLLSSVCLSPSLTKH